MLRNVFKRSQTHLSKRLTSILSGQRDRFGGVTVYSSDYPGVSDFKKVLSTSLREWRETGVRGLWFHIEDTESSNWIPSLLESGFTFHHAKDKNAVLVKWLPENESSGIPEYPSTYVGVGTITLNNNDEILAIKEKVKFYNNWKFPGGYVDRGENILDAAVREVKEETGVETEAVGIVGFRHVLPQEDIPFPPFKCSDIYVICALRTKDGGNTEIVKQEREISEAEWINVDEFLKAGSPHNTIYLQAYLDDLKAGRILTPTPFKMKYQKIDRHMLMYINKPINKNTQIDDWVKMWENGQVFWLEHEVNAGLQSYLGTPKTAFVPLCGNSNSMMFMHQKGIKVTGLEFHEDAVLRFFDENHLEYRTGEDKMKFYETKCSGIRIYVGDLFAFETEQEFDFIWDRGSLVAISPEDRGRYAVLMSSLLADGGKILLEGIQFGENPKSVYKDVGPPGAPYNLVEQMVRELYLNHNIEVLPQAEGSENDVELMKTLKEMFGEAIRTHYYISK